MKQQREPLKNKVNRKRVLNAKPTAQTKNRVFVYQRRTVDQTKVATLGEEQNGESGETKVEGISRTFNPGDCPQDSLYL